MDFLLTLTKKQPSASIKPVNHAFESKGLRSKEASIKFKGCSGHLLLSQIINLFKASILGVRIKFVINFTTIIIPS